MKTENRNRYLSSIHSGTGATHDPLVRLFNKAVLMSVVPETGTALELGENEVYLATLKSLVKRQGHATQALRFLAAEADKEGIDIVVHASPSETGDNTPGDYALGQFYRKFGFVKCGSNNLMFRPAAQQPQPESSSTSASPSAPEPASW
ncbi:MAG: hypothetical protein WC989_06370 [Micavibrio sp.]